MDCILHVCICIIYIYLPNPCTARQGRCKLLVLGRPCEVGLRRRHYYILSGSVLGVWTHLEGVFARHSSGHNNNRMQIARVQTTRKRLVGGWAEHVAL